MIYRIMKSTHHYTMHDAVAQKTYYASCSAVRESGRRELWHTQMPQQPLKRPFGEGEAWGWVNHPASWNEVGKAFLKHLTGAECGVQCLRVIASRPSLCTSVITLHFIPPVILAHCGLVFEQRGGSWSDWLSTMFLWMTEYISEGRE